MTTQTSQPIASKDATPASEQMRADFESFVRLHFGTNDNSLNRAPEGYYNHVSSDTYGGRVQPKYAPVSMLWDTWQAALSQQAAAEQVAKVREGSFGSTVVFIANGKATPKPGTLLYTSAPPAQAPVQQQIIGYRKPSRLGSQFRNSLADIFPEQRKDWIPVVDAAPVQPVQQEAQDLMKQKAAAFDEWIEKTNWVQEKINTFHVKSLGKHRADVMRDEIEYLRAKDKP